MTDIHQRAIHLLNITSSVFGDQGQSTQLSGHFINQWCAAHPHTHVSYRDVTQDEIPHLSVERVQAFFTPNDQLTAKQQDIVDYSNALIDEIKQADVIVLGLPLYNLGIPSQLKAYFDHIARAGITFRYTEKGPVGLLNDKPVYVLATRGGLYHGTPLDTQTDYIRHFFNFIGIRDIHFIYAEGLNMGADTKLTALANAQESITLSIQRHLSA